MSTFGQSLWELKVKEVTELTERLEVLEEGLEQRRGGGRWGGSLDKRVEALEKLYASSTAEERSALPSGAVRSW